MKRISLDSLIQESKASAYMQQYRYIRHKIETNQIKPIKNSPLNGKTPALHTRYWLIGPQPDYTGFIEELQFQIVPAINADYYLNHLDVYEKERKWVLLLSNYLKNQAQNAAGPVSVNERSFQIWGREKFLQKEQGKKVLAHCGVPMEQLLVYGTTEPLAYYSADRQAGQTVLIIENKDTFYSMRKYLLNGFRRMFGEEIGTVVYGSGKGILRSFTDFGFCVEPHINAPQNRILYFGDLDYEGIKIYEYLIPIGDWGAGWGPLCLDLSREGKVDYQNADTWSVVWFDHEDFEWEQNYLGEDGLLHGQSAAPDFKTLLEWYFCGSLEAEFEAATGVKPTYEWYQNGTHY